MKDSWRDAGEEAGTYQHEHNFVVGELHEGKTPREFMVHLIKKTCAVAVALNDCPVWKVSDANAENLVTRALMGEERLATILITVDYNVQGDWIDNECRACGMMYGMHSHDCSMMVAIDKGWFDMAL